MPQKFEYKTILVRGPQNGVFAHFPFKSAKIFGSRKTIPVIATFEGKSFEMSLLPHSNGTHWLHLRKEIRDAIQKEEGDTVRICIEKDELPRKVEIPDYLQWLLENEPGMLTIFGKLTFATKKFWVEFIKETKNDDTKVQRINRLFEFLRERNSG